jgi:hypothetical protein
MLWVFQLWPVRKPHLFHGGIAFHDLEQYEFVLECRSRHDSAEYQTYAQLAS